MNIPAISQINPKLYLGSVKHIRFATEEFTEKNIDVIINCCLEITHKPNPNYIVKNFPIDDGTDASIDEFLDPVVDLINHYLVNNKCVYVHCVHGKSRSASIIIYYLMKYEKMSFDKAYSKLLAIRPIISPNTNFIKELQVRDKKI